LSIYLHAYIHMCNLVKINIYKVVVTYYEQIKY